ncbi:MAG: glycosyltransferase family 10 [Patescibacteria group bacterium]
MKKIRVKICGYGERYENPRSNYFYKTLEKFYEVELSENPDYVFYIDSSFEHLKYRDCVKIFYTGENISPNFNLCDYAVGCDYVEFGDRFYRLPVYLVAVFYQPKELEQAGTIDLKKSKIFTKDDLRKKLEFCSFVYSNYRSDKSRKIIFDKFSTYKKVNSGGGYLNNVGGRIDNKLEFEAKHKFSIAFENSSRSGYTTEKIVCSLVADTIPIYWGNPDIGREFNIKRFINCHDYKSFDDVVERIKEIDQNDDLYLSIINEPVLAEGYDFQKVRDGFGVFLRHIIEQPINTARRRTINSARAIDLEKRERMIAWYVWWKNLIWRMLARAYRPFKKLRFLEKIKCAYYLNQK